MSEVTLEGSEEYIEEIGHALLGRAFDLKDVYDDTGDEAARELAEELREDAQEILGGIGSA